MNHEDGLQEHVEALAHQTEMIVPHTRSVERWVRWWPRMAWSVAVLFGALGTVLGSVTPAHADVIQCGDVLGPEGRFELDHNLDCPGPFPGLTVRDHALLDLKGHIVRCRNFAGCVVLTGTGAQLLNGAVQGGVHEGLRLEGRGWHIVKHVTSTAVDANVLVLQSDHNQLTDVVAESFINPAFAVLGSHNRVTRGIARCAGLAFDDCVVIQGDRNRLVGNFVTSSATGSFGAFGITGDANVLRGNQAVVTGGQGLAIIGNGNTVEHNILQCLGLAFDDCLVARGDQNRLTENFATSTTAGSLPRAGIAVTGDQNVLRSNRSLANRGPGITVTGAGNTLEQNTALENSPDLRDTSGDCAQNTWRQNTFRTSDPPCIDESTGGAVADLVR